MSLEMRLASHTGCTHPCTGIRHPRRTNQTSKCVAPRVQIWNEMGMLRGYFGDVARTGGIFTYVHTHALRFCRNAFSFEVMQSAMVK